MGKGSGRVRFVGFFRVLNDVLASVQRDKHALLTAVGPSAWEAAAEAEGVESDSEEEESGGYAAPSGVLGMLARVAKRAGLI